MAKHPGGRPVEFDVEVVKKLEHAFSVGCPVTEACLYAGITTRTYYNHVKEDAEDGTKEKQLFHRFKQLREKPIMAARERVVKGINESYQNAMDYLKRKHRDEFGDIQKTDVNVTGSISLTNLLNEAQQTGHSKDTGMAEESD